MRRSALVSHRARCAQRGTTAVEFALIAPLFFIFVASTIEGGRFVVSRMMLAYAVSVGARAATLSTANTASVQAAVQNAAPMLNLSSSQIEITPSTLPVAVNTQVTVSVGVVNAANKYQFTSLFPRYLSPFTSRTWSAQATMVAR